MMITKKKCPHCGFLFRLPDIRYEAPNGRILNTITNKIQATKIEFICSNCKKVLKVVKE